MFSRSRKARQLLLGVTKRAFSTAPLGANDRPLVSSGDGFAALEGLSAMPNHLNDARSSADISASALSSLRNLSRGYARNDTLMAAYLTAMLSNVLGPRSPVPRWRGDQLTEELQAGLAALWQSYLQSSVGAGDLLGSEMLRNVLRQVMVDGDLLILPFSGADGGVAFNFFLGDEFDSARTTPQTAGAFVQNGIEVDTKTGVVRGYWVRASNIGEGVFIPAAEAIHLKRSNSIKSYRGEPWAAAVLDKLHLLGTYTRVEVRRATNASRVFAALESTGGTGSIDDDDIRAGFGKLRGEGGAATGRSTVQLAEGEVIVLPPDAKLASLDMGARAAGDVEFRTRLVNEICAGLGIMPARMAGSYNDVNFSASRQAAAVEQRNYREAQQWLASSLLEPIFRLVVQDAIARGDIAMTGEQQAAALKPRWRFSAWPSTEIHRELPVLVQGVAENLISRTWALSILGDQTLEDMVDDLEREEKLLKAAGVWDNARSIMAGKAAQIVAGDDGGRPPRSEEDAPPKEET